MGPQMSFQGFFVGTSCMGTRRKSGRRYRSRKSEDVNKHFNTVSFTFGRPDVGVGLCHTKNEEDTERRRRRETLCMCVTFP